MDTQSWKSGGCHCGAVRFEVFCADEPYVTDCNCSMCTKIGFLHLIVEKSGFRLLGGENQLADYRFNTGTARHFFCKICGVKSFYVPRSHPDGYSVNYRCLDEADMARITVRAFDGQHWEQAQATHPAMAS
jgi:hypothetical protein